VRGLGAASGEPCVALEDKAGCASCFEIRRRRRIKWFSHFPVLPSHSSQQFFFMASRIPTAQQRLRHATVAQWRGVADGPIMDLPVRSAADLVGKIVAEAGLGERMKLEEVLAAWREIVGDFLFQHSRPDSIQRGVLMVRVLQPSVHHALALERPRILKRLQERLKKSGIRDVRIKHG